MTAIGAAPAAWSLEPPLIKPGKVIYAALIPWCHAPSRFFMAISPSFPMSKFTSLHEWRHAMLFPTQEKKRVVDAGELISRASTVTPELVATVAAQAGISLAATNVSAAAGRLRRHIEALAWTDAALTIMEMALPQWRLVRLVLDDGEWCCALSRHWQLPDWLDHAVEARHEMLPLAILSAVAEALVASREAAAGHTRTGPEFRQQPSDVLDVLCCENFA